MHVVNASESACQVVFHDVMDPFPKSHAVVEKWVITQIQDDDLKQAYEVDVLREGYLETGGDANDIVDRGANEVVNQGHVGKDHKVCVLRD